MLNGFHNCDILFVGRTGTGDARTQDLALAANPEPPHQSEHVAVVPGGCWEQEPGDQPPVAWSQWQSHWGQQRQVSALQTDKPSGGLNPDMDDERPVLTARSVAWPWRYWCHVWNFVMLSCMTITWHLFIPLFTSRKCLLVVRNTMAWFWERRDFFRRRLDLPWSHPVRWSFLCLPHETSLCSRWNERLDFGFQVQCRDRYSHRAYARWFGPHHPHATREACRKLHLHCKLCQHRIAVQVSAYQNIWWVLHSKIRLWGDDCFFRNNSKWPPDKIVVLRELNYIHRQS